MRVCELMRDSCESASASSCAGFAQDGTLRHGSLGARANALARPDVVGQDAYRPQTMLASLMAVAASQRSTHDVVYAAIIAASAAIVGGIIGGAIPGYFMLKAEDKRHAHTREMADQAREDEREREHRAILGTARAFVEFFERIDSIFSVALETQHWWHNDLAATIGPPALDDQKAVLGQLTSHEAGVVASVMRLIELLAAHRLLANAQEPELSGMAPLDEAARGNLENGRTAAQSGARFLRRVADLPTPQTTTET
jgi:hypothetical protein